MASRRRRRKGIGKVLTSVERKVRRIEKRPGAKRLKRNVVTTEKILPRAIVTKKIATDAVTANEAEFGVTVVTDTEPTEYLKEGTTWVNPDDGATAVYSTDSSTFITVTDAIALATAESKSATFYQNDEPIGGEYNVGDLWFDTNDDNKLYTWDGTDWVLSQDSASAQAAADAATAAVTEVSQITGTSTVYYRPSDPNVAKTITSIVVSGTTLTVSCTNHEFVTKNKIIISGYTSTYAPFNAEAVVTSVTNSNVFVAYMNISIANGVYNAQTGSVKASLVNGHAWYDTDNNNIVSVWNNGAWQNARDAQIQTALNDASAAQLTADGKNKITYSSSTPGTTANTAGDIWWQFSGGVIIGQWTGAGGTSWTQNQVGNAIIASIDAGKITAGTISAAISITSPTITTGSAGNYIKMSTAAANQIQFFANGQDASYPGLIYSTGTESTTATQIFMQSPRANGSSVNAPYLQLYQSTQAGNTGVIILHAGGTSNSSYIQLGAPTFAVNVLVGGTTTGSVLDVKGEVQADTVAVASGITTANARITSAQNEANINAFLPSGTVRNVMSQTASITNNSSVAVGILEGTIMLVRSG